MVTKFDTSGNSKSGSNILGWLLLAAAAGFVIYLINKSSKAKEAENQKPEDKPQA